MSSCWERLPLEILNLVFEFVKVEEEGATWIRQCALVCRSWKLGTEKILFSRIKLDTLEDLQLTEQLLSANGRPAISHFVKELDYNTTNALQRNHRTNFGKLDQQFPNLHYIHTDSQHALIAIYRALLSGRFRNLKMVPLPKTVYQDKLYVSCLESRKSQLKTIALFQKPFLERDTLSILCDRLNQFTRIELIQIDINSSMNQNVVYLMEKITHDIMGLEMLSQIELTLTAPVTAELIKELHLIQPILNVEKLTIKAGISDRYSACNENYMKYIMKKFPKLNHFNILSYSEVRGIGSGFNAQEERPFHLPASLSGIIARFLDYLSNLSYCNTPIIVTNDAEATYLIAQFHRNHSRLKNFFNHHILSSSRFTVADDPSNIPRLAATIHFKHEVLARIKSQMIEVTFQNGSVEGRTYRYAEYLKNVGRFMHNELTIRDCTYGSSAQILAQVYLHCSNLKRLHMIDYGARRLFQNQPSPFTACAGQPYHQDPFTEIIFTRCVLRKELFESTNRCAPALKILTLDNCLVPNRGKEKDHITVSLAGLSLYRLNIDTLSRNTEFYIKIQYTLSNKTQYIHVQPLHIYKNNPVDLEFRMVVEEVNANLYDTMMGRGLGEIYSIQVHELNKIIINYPNVTACMVL